MNKIIKSKYQASYFISLLFFFTTLPFISFANVDVYTTTGVDGFTTNLATLSNSFSDSNAVVQHQVAQVSGVDNPTFIGALSFFELDFTGTMHFSYSIRCLDSVGVSQTPDLCDENQGLDADGFVLDNDGDRYFEARLNGDFDTCSSLVDCVSKRNFHIMRNGQPVYYSPNWSSSNPDNNKQTYTIQEFNTTAWSTGIEYQVAIPSVSHFTANTSQNIYQFFVNEFHTPQSNATFETRTDAGYMTANDVVSMKITYDGVNSPVTSNPSTSPQSPFVDPFDPANYQAQPCINDEGLISNALCNATVAMFYPSPGVLADLEDLRSSALSDRFPFVYMFQFRDSVSTLFTPTGTAQPIVVPFSHFGSITIISQDMILAIPFVGLLKFTIASSLWIMFAFGIMRRITRVFNSNNTSTKD